MQETTLSTQLMVLIQIYIVALLYPTATIVDIELMSSLFSLITLLLPKSCLWS